MMLPKRVETFEENSRELLEAKIAQKTAKIAVLGLGYAGLPLALKFAEKGFPVLGLDIDKKKVENVNLGVSYIRGVPLEAAPASGLSASTDFSRLRKTDIVIICVPTPLGKTKDPDLSMVLTAGRAIAKNLHAGQLIVLQSTTYPGTTRELLLPLMEEETGLRVGEDFFLAYSPERIDPGNEAYHLKNTPKIVAGTTRACLELVQMLYHEVVDEVVPVGNTDTAEMVKILENTFRSVNIALVNEVAIMCSRLGLDVWEVIRAASTKPFGFMPFYPGPGLGGHCIPVDPHYLSWKLRLLAYKPRFIELADEINRDMPRFVVEKVIEALNRERKSVNGSKILMLGVAYKKDSEDVRESPALDVMKLLQERGAQLSYHDPWVGELAFNGERMRSVALGPKLLASRDLVVIVTDHSAFDAREIVESSRLVIDSRNLTAGIESEKITRL
ncbi:MAG TPA: nucleotide sugar dehydrogenase [Candidatus Binatia bacterium]